MQVDIDVHAFRVHDDCKIDIAHFKEGKRTPRPRDFRSADLLRDAPIGARRNAFDVLKTALRRMHPFTDKLHAAAG
jgi:hypothetical protein